MPGIATPPQVGDAAYNFTLPSTGPHNLSLAEQKGQIVVIAFWSSWCKSCPEPLSMLESIERDYRGFPLKFWAVALDENKDNVYDFIKHNKLRLHTLFDQDTRVSKQYDFNNLPAIYVVDWDGQIRYIQDGFDSDNVASLNSILQELVSNYPSKRAM